MKISTVIKRMGDKYLCHPSRQVKRLDVPLTDSVGTDIRRTFERVLAEKKQPDNVSKIIRAAK